MGDEDDGSQQWSSTSSEESDEESLGESERFPDSTYTSREEGRAKTRKHGRILSYYGQGLARGRRVRMVPERNEAVASERGAETDRDQTTTASSIEGTVNAAHQQGGQITLRDGSTAVEGIEEEKEERGVSAQSVSPADSYRGDQAELGTESVPGLDSAITSTIIVPVPTADCAPKNAFGSPSRAPLGEIESYRPKGSAHALPDGSALGGLLDYQADAGDSADGGEDSSASVTLTGSRSGSNEVPRFD